MPVVKTTSPARDVDAPNPSPSSRVPSSRNRVPPNSARVGSRGTAVKNPSGPRKRVALNLYVVQRTRTVRNVVRDAGADPASLRGLKSRRT